jgi:hypothetical protein
MIHYHGTPMTPADDMARAFSARHAMVSYEDPRQIEVCTLNVDQLRQVLLRSGGRCEVTGLRFTHEREEGARVRPFFHSFDRIDSRGGYTIDNVRAVCHCVNIAMNNWGEEVFAEMARGFVFNRYSALYAASDGK